MKTIMFNDETYGLTDSVIRGTKTKTRRTVPQSHLNAYKEYKEQTSGDVLSIRDFLVKRGYSRFYIGEVVAIAQRYQDIGISPSYVHSAKDHTKKNVSDVPIGKLPGWKNKMFVSADFMPHHIRITGIEVEKLQSISDEDIVAEGIIAVVPGWEYTTDPKRKSATLPARNLRGAFNRLIDGISKKKIFQQNPYVYVYSFELVD